MEERLNTGNLKFLDECSELKRYHKKSGAYNWTDNKPKRTADYRCPCPWKVLTAKNKIRGTYRGRSVQFKNSTDSTPEVLVDRLVSQFGQCAVMPGVQSTSFESDCHVDENLFSEDYHAESLKSPMDDRMESTSGSSSDSSDSGFQLENRLPLDAKSLSRISSATYFETLSVTDLKAILDCFQVQYAKRSKKHDCVRFVTDLWRNHVDFEISSEDSDCFIGPASLKDIEHIDDIKNLNAEALRGLMNEHNVDCKDWWTESELISRVKQLWKIVNADSVEEVESSSTMGYLDTEGVQLPDCNTTRGKQSFFSLHKITDAKNLPFSATDYSKFKFGCTATAKRFGMALAEGVIDMLEQRPITQQIVVTSSPYCFAPTATFALKIYFVKRLNEYLISVGLPVVQETKTQRFVNYMADYSQLNTDDRLKLIGRENFHIDREFVRGKTVFFLDDIKITGGHELVLQKMYRECGLDCDHFFMYFAELVNKDIGTSLENDLNFAFVKSLADVDWLIKRGGYMLNSRVIKYILQRDHEEFKSFIHTQEPNFVWKLCNYAMGNSYHNIGEFRNNFFYLQRLTM